MDVLLDNCLNRGSCTYISFPVALFSVYWAVDAVKFHTVVLTLVIDTTIEDFLKVMMRFGQIMATQGQDKDESAVRALVAEH